MAGSGKRFDVEGYLPLLRRYARVLTRHEADSDDLVQDALVRAYDRRATFQTGGNLRAWLLALTYSTFVDGWRSRRAQRARDHEYAGTQPWEADPSQPHYVHIRQIGEAFLLLPDEQRAAFHLVVVEGLTYEAAASALGVPTGTLMSRLSRARADLRAADRPKVATDDNLSQTPRREKRLRVVGGREEGNG